MPQDYFERLMKGQSLAALGLPQIDGRVLVEGVIAPRPSTQYSRKIAGINLNFTERSQVIKGKSWRDIHFRQCDFSELTFISQLIDNCVFEKCQCEEIGFWKSRLTHSVFDRCNLSEAALGGNDMVRPMPRNEYLKVTFNECNLLGTSYSCELFESCTFRNCKLTKVDFQGSVFRNCSFIGRLDEVRFRRRSPYFKDAEPNEMVGSDLSGADVTWCDFIGISMKREWFGSREDIVLLKHGPEDWKRWLGRFAGDPRFPGLDIFVESVVGCGTPAITTRKFLHECGFLDIEIDELVRIASDV